MGAISSPTKTACRPEALLGGCGRLLPSDCRSRWVGPTNRCLLSSRPRGICVRSRGRRENGFSPGVAGSVSRVSTKPGETGLGCEASVMTLRCMFRGESSSTSASSCKKPSVWARPQQGGHHRPISAPATRPRRSGVRQPPTLSTQPSGPNPLFMPLTNRRRHRRAEKRRHSAGPQTSVWAVLSSQVASGQMAPRKQRTTVRKNQKTLLHRHSRLILSALPLPTKNGKFDILAPCRPSIS